MQRWGGILFYTFLSEPSLPRLLMHNASSVNNRFCDWWNWWSNNFSSNNFSSEQFVDWYVGFSILLQLLSNLNFAEKCVLHHLFLLVGHWLMYVLIICSSTCLGMGLRWFFEPSNKFCSKVCIGEVWIVVVKSPPSVCNICRDFHVDFKDLLRNFFFCNALILGYMKYSASDWFC